MFKYDRTIEINTSGISFVGNDEFENVNNKINWSEGSRKIDITIHNKEGENKLFDTLRYDEGQYFPNKSIY